MPLSCVYGADRGHSHGLGHWGSSVPEPRGQSASPRAFRARPGLLGKRCATLQRQEARLSVPEVLTDGLDALPASRRTYASKMRFRHRELFAPP
ncbi:UNVERIFIED_CONTAM: hypothetical protein RKD50_004648 [Streptomyces canus]